MGTPGLQLPEYIAVSRVHVVVDAGHADENSLHGHIGKLKCKSWVNFTCSLSRLSTRWTVATPPPQSCAHTPLLCYQLLTTVEALTNNSRNTSKVEAVATVVALAAIVILAAEVTLAAVLVTITTLATVLLAVFKAYSTATFGLFADLTFVSG